MLLTLCVLGAAAYWAYQAMAARRDAAAAAARAVRTAGVTKGGITKTLRLTGTTAAERYSSLIAPQLRGNRNTGGGGRDGSLRGGNRGNGGSGGGSVQSNSGSSGSSGSGGSGSSSISSSSGSASTGGAVASTAGGGSSSASGASDGTNVTSTSGNAGIGMNAGMRAQTSRINRTAPNTRSTSNSRTTSPTGNNLDSNALGSTSGQLIGSGGTGGGGGGGGMGGGSEFGLVLQDAVKPGAHVKKGDVVAEFDRQYMLTRLDDYRASLAQMEASVRKMRAEAEVEKKAHDQTIANAKAALEKAQLDVKTIPVLGKIEAEKVRLAAEEAEARYKQYLSEVKYVDIGQRAQLRSAEIDLQESQVELKRSEANAERMLLKAPINGIVVMQTTFRGSEFAQIQPGDQLFPGMMFMQIVDPSSMIINASINQVDVESLKIGSKTTVRFDAYPGLELPAHVYSVGAMTRPGGQRGSFVKEIPVVLKLDKIDPRVIPDLSVSCDVVIEQEDDTVVAPLSAVFRDSSAATDSPYVYVQSGSTWEKRPVELGISSNVAISVRSGLQPGEVVATELPPLEIKKEQG